MRSINLELTQAELTWLIEGINKVVNAEIKRVRKYVHGDEDDHQIVLQCQYIARMHGLRDRLEEHLAILQASEEG